MIIGALNAQGGQAYLERASKENMPAFLALVGKVLPTTLAGDPTLPSISLKVTYVEPGEKTD